jgi:hypothetical protein
MQPSMFDGIDSILIDTAPVTYLIERHPTYEALVAALFA